MSFQHGLKRRRALEREFRCKSDCYIEGWVAAAVVGAGVVGAVGANIAAGTQASADKAATATQAGMYNNTVAQEQPFLNSGTNAETSLNQLLGTAPATGAGGTATGTNLPGGYLTSTFNPTMAQLEQTPGYQFSLEQGDQALNNQNAPGVGAVSGPALKSLMSFNQGLASTTYQNQFANYQTQQNNIFNRLSSIASLGQNAAGNLGNNGAQLGTGMAQSTAAAGAASAGGTVGATNALSGSANTLAGLMYLNGGNTTPGGSVTTPSQTVSSPTNYDGSVSYCDYALKRAIEPYRFNGMSGLMVYDFEYKNELGTKRRGYIAQEVFEKYPEAVSAGPKGYLMVDYSMLPGWDELDSIAGDLDG